MSQETPTPIGDAAEQYILQQALQRIELLYQSPTAEEAAAATRQFLQRMDAIQPQVKKLPRQQAKNVGLIISSDGRIITSVQNASFTRYAETLFPVWGIDIINLIYKFYRTQSAEAKFLGLKKKEIAYLLTVPLHTDALTYEQARKKVEEQQRKAHEFETRYYLKKNGDVEKLSIFPADILDTRQDLYGNKTSAKAVTSEMKKIDFALIDHALTAIQDKVNLSSQKGKE